MKKQIKTLRNYHNFYTPKNNSLCKNNYQEQNSSDRVIHNLSPLSEAPGIKIKTGLERFLEHYPNYQEMFVGSRK